MCSVPPPAERTTAITLSSAVRNCVAKSLVTIRASLSQAIWPEMKSVLPVAIMPFAYPRGFGKCVGVTTWCFPPRVPADVPSCVIASASHDLAPIDGDCLSVDAARKLAREGQDHVRDLVGTDEALLRVQ